MKWLFSLHYPHSDRILQVAQRSSKAAGDRRFDDANPDRPSGVHGRNIRRGGAHFVGTKVVTTADAQVQHCNWVVNPVSAALVIIQVTSTDGTKTSPCLALYPLSYGLTS